jgi:hypothetical protein
VAVNVAQPPSNSPTAGFNSYTLTFTGQNSPGGVFGTSLEATNARRTISGTLTGQLVNGQWVETIQFTTGQSATWPASGALPFNQWRGAGQPAFTMTIAPFTPPAVGETEVIPVQSTDWMVAGMPLFIDGNTYVVVGPTGPNSVSIRRVA